MKENARKTRSATRNEQSQRVQLLKKKEELVEMTDTTLNRQELAVTPSIDAIVKVEENNTSAKSQLLSPEYQKGEYWYQFFI